MKHLHREDLKIIDMERAKYPNLLKANPGDFHFDDHKGSVEVMIGKIMNKEDLQALIAVGESHVLEFKRSSSTHLGREICAFANSLGGRILIGVDDSGILHPLNNPIRSALKSNPFLEISTHQSW